MGIYDRPYYREESGLSLFSGRSMIANLIIINVAVFLIDVFLWQPRGTLSREILGVTTDTITQPWKWWQFLTYGFAHDPNNAYHLIGNMLGLFFLGNEIEQLYGRKLFLRMYLTSLVFCSLVWAVTELVADHQGRLIGASGAVTTVVMLFALNFPRRMVLFMMFIPIPAWVLGVIVVLSNLWGTQAPALNDGAPRVAYEVHLVGAFFGYLFYRTQWALGAGLPSLGGLIPSRRPKLRIHEEPEEPYRVLDEEADRVLAKLHQQGEASLTARERRTLEEYSRRMQRKLR